MAVDIFSFPLVIFLPYLAVMTSWVIRSKTSPTKPGKLSFPACKQRGAMYHQTSSPASSFSKDDTFR